LKDAKTYYSINYQCQDKNASALVGINNAIKYFTAKDNDKLSGLFCYREDRYLGNW
jgi:hypothetical protein